MMCSLTSPRALALLCLCALPIAATADDEPVSVATLTWLVGTWVHEEGEFTSEHIWIEPRGQVMLGIQRDTRAGQTRHVEFIEIRERSDGLVYHVYPIGQTPTDFRLVWADERRAVFENPEHDYPQRILYWIEGEDTLVARIEGKVDGQIRGSEWRWSREER